MSRFSNIRRTRGTAALVVFLGAACLALPAGGRGHGGHGGAGGHGGGGHAAGGPGHSAGQSSLGAGHSSPGPAARIAGGSGVPHEWRNGHWSHGMRGGQLGWWWIGAGGAYLYAQPAYSTYVPGGMIAQPPYGYYCNALEGYYPEVQTCPEPWVIVEPPAY